MTIYTGCTLPFTFTVYGIIKYLARCVHVYMYINIHTKVELLWVNYI